MTTDTNDSDDPVKPQVIELDATDVTPDAEPKEESAPPPPPPPKRRAASGNGRWIVIALILGLIAGAWLFRSVLSSYFPSSEMTALSDRVSTLEATAKTQGNQLATVSSATDEAKATASSLNEAVKNATAQSAAAQSALAAIDQRVTALKGDIDGLKKAIASAGTGSGDPAALAALAQRLDALESQVNDLKSGGISPGTTADINALRQSLSDIQAKIAAGAPYRTELDAILRVVPSVGADEVLMANADQGLPNAKGLAEELRKAIPSLPQPDKPTPESDGWFEGFWNALSMIVTVRDVGETDWPTVAGQVAQEAEQGHLASALSIIDAAEGSLPQPIAAWRSRAASRIQLESSVAAMAKAVGLVISAKGGGK